MATIKSSGKGTQAQRDAAARRIKREIKELGPNVKLSKTGRPVVILNPAKKAAGVKPLGQRKAENKIAASARKAEVLDELIPAGKRSVLMNKRPVRMEQAHDPNHPLKVPDPNLKNRMLWDCDKVMPIVLERISNRVASMNVILGTPHEGWELPSNAVIQEWLRSSPEWAIKFAHAKMSQAEIMFDQLLDIADDGTNDLMTDKHGNEHVNAEVLARSRLRVDTRRWMLGRLNSRKYGDALKLQGDAEQPLEVRNSQKMDAIVSSLSPENQKMLLEAMEKAQEADE